MLIANHFQAKKCKLKLFLVFNWLYFFLIFVFRKQKLLLFEMCE